MNRRVQSETSQKGGKNIRRIEDGTSRIEAATSRRIEGGTPQNGGRNIANRRIEDRTSRMDGGTSRTIEGGTSQNRTSRINGLRTEPQECRAEFRDESRAEFRDLTNRLATYPRRNLEWTAFGEPEIGTSEGPKSTFGEAKIDLWRAQNRRPSAMGVQRPPRAVSESSKSRPRAPQERPRAPKSPARATQDSPKSNPRAPQRSLRRFPRRPGERLETILRPPDMEKAAFADDLLCDSRNKPVGNDFSSILHLCAKASNLIWTRPYRVEMRFGSSASESTHSNERASQRHQNRSLGDSEIKSSSTKIVFPGHVWQ